MPLKDLSQYLQRLRPGGRPSLREVARRCNLTAAFLSKLELGHYESVRLETLREVARGYGVPVEELLKVAGLTEGLPTLPAYLRTKYGLSEEGVEEAEAFIARVRRKYGKARRKEQTK